MKTKLIFLMCLFLLLLSCSDDKKTEIVNMKDLKESDLKQYISFPHLLNDRIYLPPNQLTETAQLIEGNDQQLLDSIFYYYGKSYSFEDSLMNKPTIEYKFMISEDGLIEKIFFGKNNDEKINQLVLNTVKSWRFKPGVKEGKKVRAQFPMMISFMKNLSPINEDDFNPIVENMPGPIGGMSAIQEKIIYPEIAKAQAFKER